MSFSRRQFCVFMSATAATMMGKPLNYLRAENPGKDRQLTVIAYNIYKCTGWPQDRPLAEQAVSKGQMAERLALELSLHEPDIVTFSESPDDALTKEVAERLGMNHVRFPSGGNWPGTLLSRFEVVDSKNAPVVGGRRPEDLFTRHWGRATVRLSDKRELIIHSAHLHPSQSDIRQREIAEMTREMKNDFQENRSMLLMGDLNHTPEEPEYRMWLDAGWKDTFTGVGGEAGPTIKADAPKRRIDYVMATGPIAEKVTQSRPLFEGAFRLNLADEKSFALSDHLPQLAVFDLE